MTFDVVQHSRELCKLIELDIPFVTVTLLNLRGSAPPFKGAKALITSNGLEWGTVGGGKIEAAAITFAKQALETQPGTSCNLVTWNLRADVGMAIDGEVKLFFEIHNRSEWNARSHVGETPLQCDLRRLTPRVDRKAPGSSQTDQAHHR